MSRNNIILLDIFLLCISIIFHIYFIDSVMTLFTIVHFLEISLYLQTPYEN